ncbi:MAG: peptidyl-prolyl cis-trans isomerase [Desulfurivibrionaceae bacterium]|nr:peptidyl-prolyl cis-trans isomerase [Desulfurivibrionaceae bacterium]
MKKKMNRFIAAVFLLSLVSTPLAHGHGDGKSSEGPGDLDKITISLQDQASGAVEQVPLFSKRYAETPVAMVNGEPILLAELVGEVLSQHGGMDEEARVQLDYRALLERIIAIRLANQEAANIGLDQLPAVRRELDDFALATLIKTLIRNQMSGLVPDQEEVDELYAQMALEAKLTTYTLTREEDAQELLEQQAAGHDFDTLAEALVQEGKADGGIAEEYLKLRELLPNVAAAVFAMEPGTVSEVFKAEKGFLVFRLDDRRTYEDAAVREEAAAMVLQRAAAKKRDAYLAELEEKYVHFDEEAEAALDFAEIAEARPEATATEIFAELSADQRPVATIKENNEVVATVTVAEIGRELEKSLYHGTERTIDPQQMGTKKVSVLRDKVIRIIGELEARKEGIHLTRAYQDTVRKHREKLVFNTFVSKAVLPGIKVTDEEARAYYEENSAQYSTPLMLKLKELAFTNEEDAGSAMAKLRAGSDFNWVSANVTGLVAEEEKEMLHFAGALLSVTALPEGLRPKVKNVVAGDVLLYEGAADLYYVLMVEQAFLPQAKPYEQVKNEAAKAVYATKVREALDAWVTSLKDAYQTEVFIVAQK